MNDVVAPVCTAQQAPGTRQEGVRKPSHHRNCLQLQHQHQTQTQAWRLPQQRTLHPVRPHLPTKGPPQPPQPLNQKRLKVTVQLRKQEPVQLTQQNHPPECEVRKAAGFGGSQERKHHIAHKYRRAREVEAAEGVVGGKYASDGVRECGEEEVEGEGGGIGAVIWDSSPHVNDHIFLFFSLNFQFPFYFSVSYGGKAEMGLNWGASWHFLVLSPPVIRSMPPPPRLQFIFNLK